MGKKVLVCIVAIAFMVSTIGCASIFYPSRVGQTTHGTVDVGMLVLDIFLTGLVGIVVDLITGAIYLPASYCLPPGGDFDVTLDPSEVLEKLDSITLPQTGSAEFSLPVRTTDSASHQIALMVITKEGITAACTKVDFNGPCEWKRVSSRLEITAGDATSGIMRVLIDGKERAELPVEFVNTTK